MKVEKKVGKCCVSFLIVVTYAVWRTRMGVMRLLFHVGDRKQDGHNRLKSPSSTCIDSRTQSDRVPPGKPKSLTFNNLAVVPKRKIYIVTLGTTSLLSPT